MSEYNDFTNRINEIVKNAMCPIYESQKIIRDSLIPHRSIQNLIDETMRPYQELSKMCSQTTIEFSRNISKMVSSTIKNSFEIPPVSKELTESIRHMTNSYLAPRRTNVSTGNTYDFLEDLGGLPDDDFVTVDKSAIKEYKIPDSIAIPIGHSKVRIKTVFFVTLLVTIILWFVTTSIDAHQNAKESQSQLTSEERQAQLVLMEIDILNKILQSVDSSTSTQNEAIQNLKEDVQAHDSAIAELRESDQAQNKRIEALESSVHTGQGSCDTENEPENTEAKK